MSPTGPETGPPDVGAGPPDTAAAAPRRRRRLLWLAGAMAGLIALAALIALAVLIALAYAPFVRDSVRRAAVDAARDRFDTVLAIGRLDYNLLTLSVTASDVSAASTRTSGSPFFRADSLTVRLPPASLLGRLDFSSIDVVRPRLTITKGADGRYNFPDSRTRGGPTPNIRIGRLSIVGLDLQIQGTPPMAIEARDVSIDLRPQDGHIQGKLVAANGTTFRTPGGDVLSVAVDGVLGLDPDAIRIGPVTLSMPDNRIDVDGRLQFAPGPARLDLAVRASVGLATAVRVWPAIGSGRGQVIATGRISGPLSQLALTFDASSHEPVVRGIAVKKAAAQGRVEGGAVTLSSAAIELAGGRVTGAATFGLGAESTSSATLRWDRVALAGVLQALAIPSAVPMGARLDGDASMTWNHRGLPSLALAATTRALPDATPAVTAVGGRSSLAISGSRWTLDLRHELGAGTTVAGRLFGTVNGTALSATTVGGRLAVKVNTDDLSEAIGRAAGTSTAVRSAASRVHGDVQAGLDVSGTLADPVFSGSLGGDLLRVDGAGDGRLQGVVRVDRRAATFDSLSASLGGTTIHASGSVPFDRRSMDVTTSGTMDDIAVVMGGVPARWRPSGSVAVAARISGPIAAPRVDGKVTSTRVEWDFWRPGPIDADVHVADGRIQFVARVPSVNGTIQGSAVLSTPYAFDINASLEQAELQRLGAIASGLGAPALEWTGTTRLSARITGAINDERPLDVDLQVASVEGTVDGHPVRLAEPARIALSTDHVSVDVLRLQVGNTRLVASGTLAQVASGQALRLEIDGEIGEWWPQGKGRVQGVFSASGSPRHPTLSGEGDVASATVTFPGYAPLTNIVARARLANETLELVEARAAWSGAGMTAGGRIPLALLAPWLPEALVPQRPATGGLQVRADVTSLTERALEPWLGADAVSQMTGQVAAAIELEAPRLAFDALRGTAVITQSETMIEGLTIRQPKPARVRFDGGRVLVEEASWAVGNRTLTLGGGVDFRGSHPRLDLALTGVFNLALARVFLPVALSGTATIDARVSGEAQHPSFSGGVTLANAALGVPDPRIAISGVSGRLTLDDDRLVVSAQGSINGGSLDISGSLPLLGPRASEHAKEGLRLRGQGFVLEWPEGLRSMLDADLAYRADAQGGVIAGRVSVEPGVYRRTALPLPAGDQSGAADSKSSRFGATRLDVSIATASPGLLDNSFARLEVEADVHVGGTIAKPAIGGNLRAREGGEVYLRGNVFTIHRGLLELDPVARTKPTVDLTAETRRAGYNISLRLSGRTDDLIVNLSSDPPLAQPDLMSLITTGSTSNSMSPGSNSGSKDNLVAAISSDILGLAGRSLGLDSVRVGELDLDLLGDDVDPQTRLTIGKAIGNWLDLLLSQNLRASGFTWVVIVHPFGSYEIRFASRDSQTNSLELRHEVVFGGPGGRPGTKKPVPTPRTLPRVTGVSVTGGDMAEKDVLAVTRMRTGDRFEFFEWQRDRERVESLFHSRGYLEVQVSATRDVGQGGDESVALRYQIRRGPQTRLRVTGFGLPEPVIADMKTAWSRSVDDRFLQEELRERARAAMIDLGYLWGRIDSELHVTDQPREKTVDVTIVPGARAEARLVTFSGNQAVSERELRQEIERAGSAEKLWREPDAVAGALKTFYRRKGFLAARVSAAPAVLNGASARLPITIHEGPRHIVSRIDVRGAGALEPGRVERWMALRVGEPFNPEEAPLVAKRIEAGYVEAGYRSARAEVTGAVEGETGRVTVVAQVNPGIRSVIREVTITGRSQTRESVVASALKLPAGTAASPGSVDRAQHRLYETEAFRSVDIQLQPITPAIEGAGEQPTRAVVTLEEAPLYRLRYGVQLTDDLSPEIQSRDIRPGVAAELRRRNLFGSAFSGAVGGRYEWNRYSIRGALNIPTSVLWPAFSTLYVKHSVETRQEPTWFQRGETSVTYQDRWRLGRQTELSYGYAFIREDAPYSAAAARAATETGRTTRANLYAAVAWNSRDSVFNATRGWFHSSSVEYGSTTLGSDFNYLRYLLQQTHYRKMGPVVLAGAAQIGVLVNVTGDESQSYSLRFRTGGDRTIRGYAEESISPPGVKAGGRALLVLNGEVRFPVWRWLKAVAFLDAGNAFIDPAHILLRDLKVGTGFGLRLDTPYALFRLDVGFPIPQHSDRLIGRWYFSIGQTF